MGLSDFIKSVKKIFTGEDSEYEEDYRFRDLDDDSSFDEDDYSSDIEIDNDYDDDDDEIRGLTEAESRRLEKALERFMMNLTEKERESEDVDELIDDVTERYFARKISDPAKALEQGYQQLKATKVQRNEQKAKASSAIIEKLRILESLPEEERDDLVFEMNNDFKSKYHVGKIKKKDVPALAELVQSWIDPRNMNDFTDTKLWLVSHVNESVLRELIEHIKVPIIGKDNVILDEDHYKQQLYFFNNRYDEFFSKIFYYGCPSSIITDTFYDDYAEYFKRYWLESDATPQEIECDDLIVNRPCYMRMPFTLKTPHFHMGKRYFERDSNQSVVVYLFSDKLEYIADGGHYTINLSEIIDISLNAWDGLWNNDEPNLLEITCRDNHKWLFGTGHSEKLLKTSQEGDLLVLRALIYYFLKNPQLQKRK